MDDRDLLREYVAHRSEAAFAGLVNRYVNLVYSTAVRMVNDGAMAQDVAQAVFIKLAQKADTIRTGDALPGWLYRTTHSQAANTIRAEQARRRRETEAMNQAELNSEPALAWSAIASDLDEAMRSLSDAEQNAVVLRFFEGQSWREVSLALATSEDTAQRRVSGALEKLRGHFVRRGIAVSASVLALTLTTNAVQAAPAALGTSLTTGALAAISAKGAGGLSALFKFLAAKWQMTAAVLTGTAIVGITTAVVTHHPPAVNAETVKQGLVLHLGFDQEEADGRASDDSGHGNNGQVTGARWTPKGRHGGAYEFTTDGDQIVVPDHPSLDPNNITVSAWINSPGSDDTWRYVIDKGIAPGYHLMVLGDGHGGVNQGHAHSQMVRSICLCGNSVVSDGQWHLLTTTYDGQRHRLYVDGRLESAFSSPPEGISNNLDLVIGCSRYNIPARDIGKSFRGRIDEVRIYNRVLSSKEVQFLFASTD